VLVLGVCAAILGATIHGVTGAALHARTLARLGDGRLEGSAFPSLAPFVAYLVPLWTIVGAALLAGSIGFTIPVIRGESAYRRWMALASPAVLVAVIAARASIATWSRILIVPASPNLAHVLFFALASTNAATQPRA
jgi:hypothetical protein